MELLTLFSLLVKYNLPFINKEHCVSDIQQWFRDGGSVWQKFAQVLSQYEEVVGKELADALGKMCFDCPAHDDVYSARIIKDAFGSKYDTKTMKMIGSGTISQVYKVYDKTRDKFVAIKVMHPNVKREIRDACDAYNRIKQTHLLPRRLIFACTLFFSGLREQLLMNKEFKNGKMMKQLLQPIKTADYLFIVPEMIEYSKKCLVMDYEESRLFAKLDVTENLSELQQRILYKAFNATKHILITMAYNGFIHADLHCGNIGIQNPESYENMKLVIYDFGQCVNLTKFTSRTAHVDAFIYQRSLALMKCIFNEEYHHAIMPYLTNEFYDNIKYMISYVSHNDTIVDHSSIDFLIALGKNKKTGYAFILLCDVYKYESDMPFLMDHGIQKYLDKYLPYPDFDCLRKL